MKKKTQKCIGPNRNFFLVSILPFFSFPREYDILLLKGGVKMENGILTSRLRLIPCLPERLEGKRNSEADPHLKNAYGQMLEECRNHPSEWVWFTDWDILLRETGEVVGGAGFKGNPDSSGRVEIGYGISEQFRRNGYMTEALEGMCRWAFKQKNVKTILSEVEFGNDASVKTLLKNGFIETSPQENRWFIKEKPGPGMSAFRRKEIRP